LFAGLPRIDFGQIGSAEWTLPRLVCCSLHQWLVFCHLSGEDPGRSFKWA
jgi:hypothetical protein